MKWAIVLAGGEGARLRSYVLQRLGEAKPKQYCTFYGGRSMLEHTLDRAAFLAGSERTVTVVAPAHARWANDQLADHRGIVVTQPVNRETGPGLYLPLAYVRARDPNALVYILPSDHYVRPADRFCDALAAAGELATSEPDAIVLTGVPPETPDGEYGYIEPAQEWIGGARRVAGFLEKPSREVALDAIARGAMWNTMVMAATTDALWAAGRACIPDVIERFDALIPYLGTRREGDALDDAYHAMPVANFSRDVLERATDRCLVAPLPGIEWSDWGQAERIEATLSRRGRAATVPVALSVSP
jgi:mannose-1-phosphate guanylyltransferase